MANIYNFLNNVYLDIKKESSSNLGFLFTLLLLITIPLSYAVNNIALVLLLLSVIFKFKKSNFAFNSSLIIPILLFLLMVASYFWSSDANSTLNAIPKEIALLILPLVFMMMPKLSSLQKEKLIQYYSYSIVILVVYFLIRAIIRYFILHDSRVFFYHGEDGDDYGLVPKLLNAIHVSVFVALAFFYFFTKKVISKLDVLLSFLLFGFIILLSSKNIIIIFLLLVAVYYFFVSKAAHKMRLRNLILVGLIIGFLISFGKIKQRFELEFQTNTNKSLSSNVIKDLPQGVHNVSIIEAWNNKSFTPNDFFPGTAFRIYQFRMFLEIIKENDVLLKGLGLNASQPKLEELGVKYNVFLGKENMEGYQTKNFHNQYLQNFAELGVFGFLFLIIMVIINIKNAIKNKHFIHFVFAVLMISLFLTESFLWRQRGVVFFTLLYCVFNNFRVSNNSISTS
jgi:hypothetical protein